jgi:Rrf2 family protein
MLISNATDYTLRTLLYMANNENEQSEEEIAEGMNIPQSDLPDIISTLEENGIVAENNQDSTYNLKASPEDISLWDILEISDKSSDCIELVSPTTKGVAESDKFEMFPPFKEKFSVLLHNVTLKNLVDRL